MSEGATEASVQRFCDSMDVPSLITMHHQVALSIATRTSAEPPTAQDLLARFVNRGTFAVGDVLVARGASIIVRGNITKRNREWRRKMGMPGSAQSSAEAYAVELEGAPMVMLVPSAGADSSALAMVEKCRQMVECATIQAAVGWHRHITCLRLLGCDEVRLKLLVARASLR